MLLDTREQKFYVGEAADLIKRLAQPHITIPNWDFFRYSALPTELAQYRVAIERMLIRAFAAVLKNKKAISWRAIHERELANDRVDV